MRQRSIDGVPPDDRQGTMPSGQKRSRTQKGIIMTFQLTRRDVLAGFAATLAAPAFAQDKTAGSTVIYTSNNQQSVQAVLDTGAQLLPNVKISAINGGSAQMLRRVESELSRPQADIFWSASANTLGAFRQLFVPYRSPAASAIPPALVDKENLWTASNMHVAVMMVNNNQLGGNPAPKTWSDLMDRRWKGKVIIADPVNSSTAYTILWGIREQLGPEGLKRLASNVVVTAQAATVLRAVAQGEYAVGLTFESNGYAYVAGGQKEIELVYPSEGTFTNPEFVVLLKGAPNEAAAKKTYDLLLAKETQIALLEAAYRRPSRTDIDVSKYVKLPNLDGIKSFPIEDAVAAKDRDNFLAEWNAAVAAGK